MPKPKNAPKAEPRPELVVVYEHEGTAPPEGFVVRHKPSNSWWRAGRGGYSGNLLCAGIYTEAEAREIEKLRDEDEAVPLAAAVRDFVGVSKPNPLILAAVAALGGR